MDGKKFAALLLLVAGALAFGYGGVAYVHEAHQIDPGAIRVTTDQKQHVTLQVWAGVASMLAGGLLLSLPRKV